MAKVIRKVEHDIKFVLAVDCSALSVQSEGTYPRVGDFIAISEISEVAMLRQLFLELFPKIGEGEITYLDGGVCLMENGVVLIEPQCCADFSDIDSWETIIQFGTEKHLANEWIKVWFGHPRLAARQDGNNVWLAEDNDTDKYPILPRKGAEILCVPVAALRYALDNAHLDLKNLETRLNIALMGLVPEHLRQAAINKMLYGLNGEYDGLRADDVANKVTNKVGEEGGETRSVSPERKAEASEVPKMEMSRFRRAVETARRWASSLKRSSPRRRS